MRKEVKLIEWKNLSHYKESKKAEDVIREAIVLMDIEGQKAAGDEMRKVEKRWRRWHKC